MLLCGARNPRDRPMDGNMDRIFNFRGSVLHRFGEDHTETVLASSRNDLAFSLCTHVRFHDLGEDLESFRRKNALLFQRGFELRTQL